jgi:O-antigen ligase
MFWLFSTVPRNDEDRAKLLQLMFLSASIVGLIGLLQAANIAPVVDFIQSWFPSDQTAAAGRLGRITSVFGAWNTLGTYLMTNVMLLAAFQRETTVRRYRINMGISAALSLLALLASGSYASLLGLVLGIGIIKLIDPRGIRAALPLLMVGVIGFVILFPLISERFAFQFERSESGWIPQTLEFRLKVWSDIYLPLIARSPIWGVQPTLEGVSFEHAESQYLLLLFRSGWVSLIGFLIWIGTLLAWSGSIIRGERNAMRSGAIFVFALVITLLVMSFTNPVFTYSGTVDYMWMMLGLIASKQKGKLHVAG